MTHSSRAITSIRLACVLSMISGVCAHAVTSPRVAVSVDRQTATVGDPIRLTLTVQHRKDWKQIPQVLPKKLGEFDVLRDTTYTDRWREGGDGLHSKREITLAIFRPGGFWIPALSGQTIAGADTVTWQSDSLTIVIESVLDRPDADTTDIAGLKGPYVAPEPKWYWWISGAIALAAIALYIYYRRRKRAALPVFKAPPPPAWEVALRELANLRMDVRPGSDGGRLWYFRLSDILRRYWDGRFGWQSIDQTTSEIVRQFPQAPFNGEHRTRAEEFLRFADRVRYAKQPAVEGRPEVDWEWVHSFVKDTIPLRIPTDDQEPAEQERVEA